MEFSKKSLHCPTHPKETVTRISMDPSATKQVFCIECLMDMEGWDRETIIPISDFIENAAKTYESMTSHTKKGDVNSKYQKAMDHRFEKISDLTAHFQSEKQKVKKEFEAIIVEFTKFIEDRRDSYCDLLDQQLVTFQNNFTFFEKALNKASASSSYPSKQELVEKINKCTSPDELVSLIHEINQDLKENKSITDSAEVFEKINEKLEKNFKNTPSLALLENTDQTPLKDNFKQAASFYLERVFTLQNEFENIVTTSYPESAILSPDDFVLLQKWLHYSLRSKRFKLLYSTTKHEKSVSELNEKVFGHENTYFVYKTSGEKVFGGFMPADFGKYQKYFQSPGAFLYSLDTKTKYEGKLGLNHGWTDANSWGCCFGADVYVNISSMSGTTNNPSAYDYPDYNTLSGSNTWTCSEIEVYTLE